VIQGRLYIGTRAQAQNWTLLHGLGATHIVNVSRDTTSPFAGKLEYHQCGIADTESADVTSAGASALRYMTEAFNRSPSTCVVVHCASGVSRSVAVVLYYLICKEGMSFETAMRRLQKAHPAANPNPGFVSQLRALDGGGPIGQADQVTPSDHAAAAMSSLPGSRACVQADSYDAALGGASGREDVACVPAPSRLTSWARMPSVESVGWMTRASYPPARQCGWSVSRSASSVSLRASALCVSGNPVEIAPSIARKGPLQAERMVVEGVEAVARVEQGGAGGEETKTDEDNKSVASTSVATSEGASEVSELSEGELSEGATSGGNSPRAGTRALPPLPPARSGITCGVGEGVALFWHGTGVEVQGEQAGDKGGREVHQC